MTKTIAAQRDALPQYLSAYSNVSELKPNHADHTAIVSVYSGRPGCACGCRGKHSDDPKTIKRIVNNMLKIQPVIKRDGNNFSVETDTRLYIAYVSNEVF